MRDACLSHDTALAPHELCDINPGGIHVTVPRDRRLRRAGGDRYVLHQEDLRQEQIGWWEAIPIVTAKTASRPRFLLKGGTYLQHRLNWTDRAATDIDIDIDIDIDGIVRGDLTDFIIDLDGTLAYARGGGLRRDAVITGFTVPSSPDGAPTGG